MEVSEKSQTISIGPKICILAGIFPPDIGGPAIYTERLAEELTKRSVKVAVVAYGNNNKNQKSKSSTVPHSKNQNDKLKFKNYNFSVIRISRQLPSIVRYLLYFWKVLRLAKDYDILYAQTLFSAGIPGLLAARLLKKKIVVKIVGDHAWERLNSSKITVEDFQKQKYNWRIEFLRKAQSYLLKKVDQIITPSIYLKKIIAGWGVPSEKIKVVYNAPDESFASRFSKQEARKILGIEGDILLSVGRLVSWKGFDALISIMPDLLNENPHLRLLIIGDGPEKGSLELKIKKLRLEGKVKLAGKVSHKEMPLYFRAADVFVLNTNYEGFSHVILEAMAAGVAVIATNVGGNLELLTDRDNGFLVAYNNQEQLKQAILRLIQDKDLQQRFIAKGKECLKKFTWPKLVDETLKVFNSL